MPSRARGVVHLGEPRGWVGCGCGPGKGGSEVAGEDPDHMLRSLQYLSGEGVLDPEMSGIIRHALLLHTYVFSFLGPRSWHMEVPRLGVESEL